MSSANPNDIAYQIIIAADQAIKDLGALTTEATTFDERITMAANAAMAFGEKWGISGNAAVGVLKDADASLNGTLDKSQIFAEVGPRAWQDVGAAVRTATNDMNAFEHGIDFIRVALGTMSAMLVFQVINAITTTFKDAIQYAKDYEAALYQIQVAQDILARSGINVNQQDLLDIANQIEKTYGVFAHVDMVDAVAQASLLTREFGFSKDQIAQVVEIGAALAIQQGNIKNITQDIEQVTRAITSGNAPAALSKLGIDVTANQVKELGAQLYGANHAMTDQEKNAVTLALAYQHMNKEVGDFSNYQKTLPGIQDQNASSWKNLMTTIGQGLSPVIELVNILVSGIIKIGQEIVNSGTAFQAFDIVMGMIFSGQVKNLSDLEGAWNKAYAAASRIKDEFGSGLSNSANTATQSINQVSAAVDQLDSKNLDSLINSVTNFAEQAAQLAENLQNQEQTSWENYQTSLARAQEDYQISVANTVAEYNTRRAEIEANYRNNEITAEAKFQEQMRQLREKYLFDLEDALRNRDARQVLRLMAQYEMNKTAATNEYNIEKEQRQRQYQEELSQAKAQEEAKLAQMAEAEKIKEQRMEEDYQTEKARQEQRYAQQLADLKKNWDDKLKQEAQKLGEQYGLNQTQTDQLYELLKSYYGPDGYFDGLYSYSYDSLVARSEALLGALNSMISSFNSAVSSLSGVTSSYGTNSSTWAGVSSSTGSNSGGSSSSSSGGSGASNTRYASGGMEIVNSPTRSPMGATYGEAGPEAHLFLPLGRSVATPSLGSIGNMGDRQGKASIEISLSPDLEARIQENTLDQAGNIVARIVRSK